MPLWRPESQPEHSASRLVCALFVFKLCFCPAPFASRGGKEQRPNPMMYESAWRQKLAVAAAILLLVLVTQAAVMAQNLGTAPQVNVAVQGQTGAQPEGTFLNLINWIGNVIAPVGAGGAALMAIGSFAMGRGFGKWVFTAIGLLLVSGVTRLLEFWIANGTGGVT
jgi:hypothetical protein